MSNITIQPNASGTGTFSIASPNSNTSRTLTLPDTTGELLNDASSLASGKLTGALPAIDGSALTGVGASTTAGAVGTYAYMHETGVNIPQRTFGDTLSGSSLHPTSMNNSQSGGPYWGITGTAASAVLGTWGCMGYYDPNSAANDKPTTLWVRIS